MARTDIPKPVRDLILRHIDSVQQVEILALLHGHPEKAWTAAELSRTLQIGPASSAEWVERFAAAGLVRPADGGVRHAGKRAVDDLVDLYARRRTSVIEAIYSKPSTAIQSFSDAFRIRRNED
jgi:hypothetical protein